MSNIDKMRPQKMHNKVLLLREKSGVEFFIKNQESFINVDYPCCFSSENKLLSHMLVLARKK